MHRYYFLLFCLVLTVVVIILAVGQPTDKRPAPGGGVGILPKQAPNPARQVPRIPTPAQPRYPNSLLPRDLVSLTPIYPHMPPEPAPLSRYVAMPARPQETVMPTTALVAIPKLVDVNEPPPLPILSRAPLRDRASLSDVTLAASVAASQSAPLPVRTNPVPFLAMNLPDPFEHQQYIRLPNAPPEEGPLLTIPAAILVAPKK